MAEPLLNVYCQRKPCCEYPVTLRIAMDDGTVQTYVLQSQMGFNLPRLNENLDKLKAGYPKKRRRNRR